MGGGATCPVILHCNTASMQCVQCYTAGCLGCPPSPPASLLSAVSFEWFYPRKLRKAGSQSLGCSSECWRALELHLLPACRRRDQAGADCDEFRPKMLQGKQSKKQRSWAIPAGNIVPTTLDRWPSQLLGEQSC